MITKMCLMPPFPAATRLKKKTKKQDFPGGAVDKSPPDDTEGTGSIPGPGTKPSATGLSN